jgi:hypothetical protein
MATRVFSNIDALPHGRSAGATHRARCAPSEDMIGNDNYFTQSSNSRSVCIVVIGNDVIKMGIISDATA